MKTLNITLKGNALLGLLLMVLLSACKDDLPSAMDTSSKFTNLESIRIVNAGADGNTVLEGTINHDTKQISFPRIEPDTDFSGLRFEIQASGGARLEQEAYEIPFATGQSTRTIVMKVINDPRSTEYFATFRLNVPVFGAEFDKAQTYDFMPYGSFAGLSTRGTGFDGQHVLIVDRAGPHLLAVSDLKNNIANNKIPVNVTGLVHDSPVYGTHAYNQGAQINGHTYMINLSTSQNQPVKMYHWTDPSATPQEIGSFNVANITGAGLRHGDNASFNLDADGNGYIYLISNNAAPAPILRFTVTNYTTVSDPFVIVAPVAYGQWSSYLQVGNTSQYLLTSNTQPISIVNVNGTSDYTLPTTAVSLKATGARVIHFNEERYLLQITVARTGTETTVLEMYDITRGSNVQEALTLFVEGEDKAPIYSSTLSSVTNTAPASQTGYHIVKDAEGNDESLMIFAAAADVGFTIVEFPKKSLDD